MVDVRSRAFAIAGFAFSGLAAGFVIAAYASPYWVETEAKVAPSGFERMGLWVACFHNYYPTDRPATQKLYEGCWPAISFEIAALYDRFFPPWVRAVQALMTLAMLQAVACVIINVIYFIHCCPFKTEKILVLISTILIFLAAFFILLCCIIFGVKVDQDREWFPQPDSVFLAWGYGLAILSGFLALFSGMCMVTDFMRMRIEDSYNRGRNPTAAPPPSYDHTVKYRPRY